MRENRKPDEFCASLNHRIHLKFLKKDAESVEKDLCTAPNADSATFEAELFTPSRTRLFVLGP